MKNNGMTLFVVKILAAGVRRVMDSDVLVSILSMQFGKLQRIQKCFEIYLIISSAGEGICRACSVVHLAQVVHSFILQLLLIV